MILNKSPSHMTTAQWSVHRCISLCETSRALAGGPRGLRSEEHAQLSGTPWGEARERKRAGPRGAPPTLRPAWPSRTGAPRPPGRRRRSRPRSARARRRARSVGVGQRGSLGGGFGFRASSPRVPMTGAPRGQTPFEAKQAERRASPRRPPEVFWAAQRHLCEACGRRPPCVRRNCDACRGVRRLRPSRSKG